MSQPWWQTTAIYQIYPRSFQDSNQDGIGDLPGIRHRLGYVKALGVGAIWISPIYPSPMKDFGYDVADYCGIDPLFGSMADFDALLAAAHQAGLRVILDIVPNHTSDTHPWFIESRSSRQSPRRDWYIWKDPGPDLSAPNNWLSEFGGSAWEYDETTGQHYYHAFLSSQPDLNWRNPQVRAAIYDVMRFWLRKGVDGFRVDVMWHLMKDESFRDNPQNPSFQDGQPPHERLLPVHSADVADVHKVVAEMRRVIDEFDDRVLIGEIYLPVQRLVSYYGAANDGAHLPYNFALLRAPWNAPELARLIEAYERALPAGAWPNWVLGNHDRPRIAGRVGAAQARVAAMLLFTLRGTPTLYCGDELGLPQVDIPPGRIRDPFELNVPGKGVGRDGARTPMQWDASAYSGFSTVEPWLPLSDDWKTRNVAVQQGEPASILGLTRALLALRTLSAALTTGNIGQIEAQGDVLCYQRDCRDEHVFVALNLSSRPQPVRLPRGGLIVLSTVPGRDGTSLDAESQLEADEGVVLHLSG